MYVDTSVAVAIYAREPESDKYESILRTGHGFYSSALLAGELTRALLAKEKNNIIDRRLRVLIQETFNEHVADGVVQLLPFHELVMKDAIEVMQQVYPDVLLRSLDAVHLATYLSVDAGPLFTRDKRMREAAKRLNIPLADG